MKNLGIAARKSDAGGGYGATQGLSHKNKNKSNRNTKSTGGMRSGSVNKNRGRGRGNCEGMHNPIPNMPIFRYLSTKIGR